jgi:hypothetical protein
MRKDLKKEVMKRIGTWIAEYDNQGTLEISFPRKDIFRLEFENDGAVFICLKQYYEEFLKMKDQIFPNIKITFKQ